MNCTEDNLVVLTARKQKWLIRLLFVLITCAILFCIFEIIVGVLAVKSYFSLNSLSERQYLAVYSFYGNNNQLGFASVTFTTCSKQRERDINIEESFLTEDLPKAVAKRVAKQLQIATLSEEKLAPINFVLLKETPVKSCETSKN